MNFYTVFKISGLAAVAAAVLLASSARGADSPKLVEPLAKAKPQYRYTIKCPGDWVVDVSKGGDTMFGGATCYPKGGFQGPVSLRAENALDQAKSPYVVTMAMLMGILDKETAAYYSTKEGLSNLPPFKRYKIIALDGGFSVEKPQIKFSLEDKKSGFKGKGRFDVRPDLHMAIATVYAAPAKEYSDTLGRSVTESVSLK